MNKISKFVDCKIVLTLRRSIDIRPSFWLAAKVSTKSQPLNII